MPGAVLLVSAMESMRNQSAGIASYGAIWRVERDSFVWNAKEAPPNWAFVHVLDLTKEDALYLRERWGVTREVQYQNMDLETDTGEARFYGAQPINSYGDGVLVQADIQQALDEWEITPIRTDTNEVISGGNVADAGRSSGFLGIDRTNHRWLEPGEGVEHISYTQSQHLYKVYLRQTLVGSELQKAFDKTKEELEKRGCVVQNADSQTKTFEYILQRNDVSGWMQQRLEQDNSADGRYHGYRIPSSIMDSIVAGTMGGKTYNYQTNIISSPRAPQSGEFVMLDDRLQASIHHTNNDGGDVGTQIEKLTPGRRIQINGSPAEIATIIHNAVRSDMTFTEVVPWLLGTVEPITLYNGASIRPYYAEGTWNQLENSIEDMRLA